MPNYQNSKIYVLKRTKDDSIFYVGSTTVGLSQRMNGHRSALTNEQKKKYAVYRHINNKGGLGTFYIELYKKYPCESIEELRKMEGRVILRLKGNGIKLQNEQIAGRTRVDGMKEYRKTDKYKAYDKEYRQTNKRKEWEKAYEKTDKRKNDVRAYRERFRNTNVVCDCGQTYMKSHKARHERTAKHIRLMAQQQDD